MNSEMDVQIIDRVTDAIQGVFDAALREQCSIAAKAAIAAMGDRQVHTAEGHESASAVSAASPASGNASEIPVLSEQERYERLKEMTKHLPPFPRPDGNPWFWDNEEIAILRAACARRFDETLRTESLFSIAATAIRIYISRTTEPVTSDDKALYHLGEVLTMLAELHPDDQCRAYVEALSYHNANSPDGVIVPTEGYSSRIVTTGPLDRVLQPKEQPDGCTASFKQWYKEKNGAEYHEHSNRHEDKFVWYARGATQGFDAGWERSTKRVSPELEPTVGWVNCPVCGEPDMRRTRDDTNFYVHCVNGNCGSNGGDNFDAIPKRESVDEVKTLNAMLENEQALRRTAEAVAPPAPDWVPYQIGDQIPPGDAIIEVRYRNGDFSLSNPDRADQWHWDECGDYTIDAYRIVEQGRRG